jgi:hypothetical protein
MAREVSKDWPIEKLLAPWLTQPGGDCWFIWMLAGDPIEAMGKLPHPKKWVAFEKRGRPYIADANRLFARLGRAALRRGTR